MTSSTISKPHYTEHAWYNPKFLLLEYFKCLMIPFQQNFPRPWWVVINTKAIPHKYLYLTKNSKKPSVQKAIFTPNFVCSRQVFHKSKHSHKLPPRQQGQHERPSSLTELVSLTILNITSLKMVINDKKNLLPLVASLLYHCHWKDGYRNFLI